MRFPIYSEDGNTLTNLKGEKVYFFKVELTDLEIDRDLDRFIQRVTRSIIRLPENDTLRVLSLDDEVYLASTNKDVSITGYKLTAIDNPLSIMGVDYQNAEFLVFDDYFVINGNYCKLLSVKSFPEKLSFNALQGLSHYILNFRKHLPELAKAKLSFRRRLHFSNTLTGIKNIESEQAYKESEELLEAITKSEEALFDGELFFLVMGESKSDLDQKERELISDLKHLEINTRTESRALTYFLCETIPGVTSTFKRSFLMPSSFIGALLPMHRDFVMDDGVTFKAVSGREVYFSLFNKSAHNYNALITGQSGQGKSMLANKLIAEELERGTKAVILDLGGSFRKLTRFYGGVEFEGKFNPLAFKDPIFLKEFISSFLDFELDGKEQGRLVKAIASNLEVKTFRELVENLDQEFEELSSYFVEYWDYFSDEELHEYELLYCDLFHYPERLKSPLILYLVEAFKRMEGKKVFLFDEAWNMLLKHAEFVAESFRTFRKYNASAVAIGQNLEDFIASPLGRVIAQNCFYKFYFKQSMTPNEFAGSFEIERINFLHSIKGKYSEFFLSYEEMAKTLRFTPSYLEYELFTSDRNDNSLFDAYYAEKGRFINFDQAITNFTQIKYGEKTI